MPVKEMTKPRKAMLPEITHKNEMKNVSDILTSQSMYTSSLRTLSVFTYYRTVFLI